MHPQHADFSIEPQHRREHAAGERSIVANRLEGAAFVERHFRQANVRRIRAKLGVFAKAKLQSFPVATQICDDLRVENLPQLLLRRLQQGFDPRRFAEPAGHVKQLRRAALSRFRIAQLGLQLRGKCAINNPMPSITASVIAYWASLIAKEKLGETKK